ncbi:uncharacterized protein JCM6883_005195 [Sporobolomyces salmoneus]|uniref:uncharacterized protein n=1 Tax=Sporobolomyces salmoneus TaxID=183962 RepID=UPI00316BF3BD
MLSIYQCLPRLGTRSRFLPHQFSTSSKTSQVSWSEEPKPKKPSWSAPKYPTPAPTARSKPGRRKPMPRVIEHKPPTPEDLERARLRRIQRAERLERKDLTAQMTETKTYMGGFTQPRHLHFLNTLDPTRKEKDSREIRVGENRVRPAAEAYEPHTVYLAVTRYPIRWGHGRSTRRECFSGYCKESELGERFKELNYGVWKEEETHFVKLAHGKPKEPVVTPAHWHCSSDSKEYLDLAIMPGSPEERSLLNKPISGRLKALLKEIKQERAKLASSSEPEPERTTLKQLEELEKTTRAELHPVVSKNYKRPEPPYLDPRLVVPILTVTLPTRPLASTLARLCNGHPRGLPFISSIPNEDRKDGPSTFRRLLRMRSNRILELTKELVYKLQGHAGGLMSLRLSPEDRGRGIEGEGLGQEIKEPERGWAEISWLDEKSEIWNGIERESYLDSWANLDGVRTGPKLIEEGYQVRSEGAVESIEGVKEAEVEARGAEQEEPVRVEEDAKSIA